METPAEEPSTSAEEPATPAPTRKARKKVQMEAPPPPVPAIDAQFWGEMLNTKREMDREATRLRYSNLVVFK
jgi:hypothetical protein